MPKLPPLELIRRIANTLQDNFLAHELPAKERGALSQYLRAQPEEHRDLWPGYFPTRMGEPMDLREFRSLSGLDDPQPGEPWYHGGESTLKLYDPAFFTRKPSDAAWYAVEKKESGGRPGHALGMIGKYNIDAQSPARLQDMLRLLVEEPSVSKDWAGLHYKGPDTMNLNDLLYSPSARDALKDRGFDSALVSDVLERDEIPALIPMSLDQVHPLSRRAATWGHREDIPSQYVTPIDDNDNDYYNWIGPERKFNRKARGGSV